MNVLVTGATGFVGRHVVRALQRRSAGIITACGRRANSQLDCRYLSCDVTADRADWFERLGRPDVVIHLAWDALSDYHDQGHFEQLARHYRFLYRLVQAGTGLIVGAGTCFEYGLQEGALTEETPACPTLPYAVAKDSLRRFLECLQQTAAFRLRWLRLFYMYGTGQPERALIPQLDRALDQNRPFPMSSGEQLRDYLPVVTAADYIVKATLQHEVGGVLNICSGEPISVRRLVERRMRERGRAVDLQLGRYPYPKHEPFAFWGSDRKLRQALQAYQQMPPRSCPNSGLHAATNQRFLSATATNA